MISGIIRCENENPKNAKVLILDDHIAHIEGHFRYIFRRGMIVHILKHIKFHRLRKKMRLPIIEINKKGKIKVY